MIRGAVIGLAALAVAVPALAAEPESGEVSAASPAVQWKGKAAGYTFGTVGSLNGAFPGCDAPYCDEFTLGVKDKADLVVAAATDNGDAFTSLEIEEPDGTIHYNGGSGGTTKTAIKLKQAKPGTYLVRTMTNNPPARGDEYSASATLAVPRPPASPPPSSPAPPPVQAAPPAVAPPTITVRPGRLSARKARGRLKVGLSSDGRLTGLVATLKKGSKMVGSGRLATLDGPGRIVLKVKKLRKGSYTFRVAGKSGAGNVVATQVQLKIGR